jgi:hypothetical protein
MNISAHASKSPNRSFDKKHNRWQALKTQTHTHTHLATINLELVDEELISKGRDQKKKSINHHLQQKKMLADLLHNTRPSIR